jgi:cell division protein FtsL
MDQVRKITQAYSQTPWRKQMQAVGMFLAILVMGTVIAMIYVNVSAEAAAVGREIQEMQEEIENLERSIENKQSELAYITSAVEMEKRAKDMGFKPVEPGQSMFIVIEGYTGRTEASLAPPSVMTSAQKVALSPEYTLSLVDWLRQQLYLPARP